MPGAEGEAPSKNPDLHGNAPDTAPTALVIIDMINDLEFDGGETLRDPAVRAAERIASLRKRCRAAGIPVVYVNDNFGRWRSDFREVIDHCLTAEVRGRRLVELLRPDSQDYFVLKPKHSAFYSTTFETLLEYLGAERLILTGITGDICVLFTAGDAHMRDFRIHVPADCIASVSEEHNRHALEYMQRVLDADATPSDELDLGRLSRRPDREE